MFAARNADITFSDVKLVVDGREVIDNGDTGGTGGTGEIGGTGETGDTGETGGTQPNEQGNTSSGTTTDVQTGDHLPVAEMILLCCISSGLFLTTIAVKRKRKMN
jgi:hypothetical protein